MAQGPGIKSCKVQVTVLCLQGLIPERYIINQKIRCIIYKSKNKRHYLQIKNQKLKNRRNKK